MPKGIFKRTKEHNRKLSEVQKGKKRSAETKRKISEGRKGIKSTLGYKHTEAAKTKCRLANLGRKHSEETRRKMREAHKGEKHPNWQGGITPINEKIRKSLEYRLWREAVFKRDNYTCVWCGDNKGGNLNADHIKPFAIYPELRFALDNGRTLCVPCHRTTDTYGWLSYRKNKTNAV